MSHTPNFDAKVKAILDATQPGERICALTGEKWMMTEKDIEMFRHHQVPPLTVHPESYLKKMLPLHTGFSWWWNTDVTTGKPIITNVHPYSGFKVMNDDNWYNENFTKHGRDIDSRRPFFDQWHELVRAVPISAQKNIEKPHNSIARHSFGDENSYFVEGCISKRSYFCSGSFHVEDSAEICYSQNISESYNISHCVNMNNCIVGRECRDCLRSSFIFDCRNCDSCFMSFNQRNKRFLFYNEQLTEAEWKERMEKIDLGDHDVFATFMNEFKRKLDGEAVWPENFNERCENSTGEYLQKCVNAERAWFSDRATNVRWAIWDNFTSEDDAVGIDPGSTHCYGNPAAINSSNCKFCYFATRCRDCEYCFEVYDCENCFGCAGLRREKFCILNKQCSEDEYWVRLDELKCAMLDRGEYGEVMPQRFVLTPFVHSPFHSVFEATEQIKSQIGVVDYEPSLDGAFGDWEGKEMHEIDELPKNIRDVDDDWVGKPIIDRSVMRPFAILAPELAFYRRMRLPVRRGHFAPHVESMLFALNMFEQIHRTCRNCHTEIVASKNTAYPNRKIYCRSCYLDFLEKSG